MSGAALPEGTAAAVTGVTTGTGFGVATTAAIGVVMGPGVMPTCATVGGAWAPVKVWGGRYESRGGVRSTE